jgi:hypothetical protein
LLRRRNRPPRALARPTTTYRDRNGIRAYDAGVEFSAYDADDELMFAFV